MCVCTFCMKHKHFYEYNIDHAVISRFRWYTNAIQHVQVYHVGDRRMYADDPLRIQYVSECQCHKEQSYSMDTYASTNENKGRRSPRSGFLKLALHSRYAVVMPRGELVRQFVHHVSVYHGVQILAQHVEKKPITDLTTTHYGLYGVPSYQTKPHSQQVDPRARRKYY